MESKDKFRRLALNQFIPDLNYSEFYFLFRTVFYHSPYSYRCCACSYTHEYVEYLSDDGTVDEEMYNLIEGNIIAGQCPHVKDSPRKYVKETKVYAIHIAVASNNIEAVSKDFLHYRYVPTRIFKVTPFRLALLRGNSEILKMAQTASFNLSPLLHAKKFMFAYRSNNKTTLGIEFISSSVFCIRYRRNLLKQVLNPSTVHGDIYETLALSFKNGDQELEEDILEYIYHMLKVGKEEILADCAICAIMFNQQDSLQKILQLLYSGDVALVCFQRVFAACKALNRQRCLEILKTFDQRDHNEIDKFNTLVILLSSYHASFSSEIISALRSIPSIYDRLNNQYHGNMSVLQIYTSRYQPIAVGEIKALVEAGGDIDFVGSDGNTLLQLILSKRSNFIGFRETLELLLYVNPDKTVNVEAVERAISLDEFIENSVNIPFVIDLNGNFVPDGREHSFFGEPDDRAYALNFLGPLLIECGFPYSRETVASALEQHLHETEAAYLRKCLSKPRSLKLCCRDSLRNHFKKQSVHLFVEVSNIPPTVKNFILLKPELVRSF